MAETEHTEETQQAPEGLDGYPNRYRHALRVFDWLPPMLESGHAQPKGELPKVLRQLEADLTDGVHALAVTYGVHYLNHPDETVKAITVKAERARAGRFPDMSKTDHGQFRITIDFGRPGSLLNIADGSRTLPSLLFGQLAEYIHEHPSYKDVLDMDARPMTLQSDDPNQILDLLNKAIFKPVNPHYAVEVPEWLSRLPSSGSKANAR